MKVESEACFLCGCKENIDEHHCVFHTNFKSGFGRSAKNSLTLPVCRSCHSIIHTISKSCCSPQSAAKTYKRYIYAKLGEDEFSNLNPTEKICVMVSDKSFLVMLDAVMSSHLIPLLCPDFCGIKYSIVVEEFGINDYSFLYDEISSMFGKYWSNVSTVSSIVSSGFIYQPPISFCSCVSDEERDLVDINTRAKIKCIIRKYFNFAGKRESWNSLDAIHRRIKFSHKLFRTVDFSVVKLAVEEMAINGELIEELRKVSEVETRGGKAYKKYKNKLYYKATEKIIRESRE